MRWQWRWQVGWPEAVAEAVDVRACSSCVRGDGIFRSVAILTVDRPPLSVAAALPLKCSAKLLVATSIMLELWSEGCARCPSSIGASLGEKVSYQGREVWGK